MSQKQQTMKTIIAEKPSVAKEIAHIVGADKREEGYMQGNGYYVTWAFGHLVQPAMPETYGMKGFHAENLPVIPDPFVLVPRQVKTENGYKPDAGVLAQIKIIGKLFDSSERIIVATDAGREGELIFRYLYAYLGCRKPFDRLWISSLTDTAIREGLLNLRDGKEYDNLYHAAKARSEADWLVGINGTQALTIAAGRGTYSVGRVQTPMTMPGQRKIYQIPDQVVANYRYFVENDEEPVTAAPVPLKKGIKVRVVAGSMKGVEAYVQSYNGKKAVIGSEIKYISGATLTISRNLLEVVEED